MFLLFTYLYLFAPGAPLKLEKNVIFWHKIVIFHTKYPPGAPLKLEKNVIFWHKIVIFHTKYPNNFRTSLRN